MRSLLLVPGHDIKALAQANTSAADVIVLDLTAKTAKDATSSRANVLGWLERNAGRRPCYVKVNSLGSGQIDADLDATMPGNPTGVFLPAITHGRDISHLAAKLAVREAECGIADGQTRIIAGALDTPSAIFGIGSCTGASHRLTGLSWDAAALARHLALPSDWNAVNTINPALQHARVTCAYAASAAEVVAIDTACPSLFSLQQLKDDAENARMTGHSAKLALQEDHISVINAVYGIAAVRS